MPKTGLKIEYIPLTELQPAERNPKDHDLGAIINSLRRFGFVAPGVVNETTGRIVAGHGRAEALAEMKATGELPPKRIREDKEGQWLIPFVRGIEFENDTEAEAYIVADNRLTELGGWDWGMLPAVLTDLRDADLLEVVGYDEEELEKMVRDLQPPPEFPNVPSSPETSHQCPKCGYKWKGATK